MSTVFVSKTDPFGFVDVEWLKTPEYNKQTQITKVIRVRTHGDKKAKWTSLTKAELARSYKPMSGIEAKNHRLEEYE